ncbi:MAG: beta-N-acetylhexosaminidase [Kiritimatiellae bacterium]|nr:beta-N-acetylhexosaminidase [Kiritimatiellia bacterium]
MERGRRIVAAAAAWLAVSHAAPGAEPIAAQRTGGELVLYDAATQGNEAISNGTWPGGDMRPVSRIMRKAGRTYAEFSYTGARGKARTVFGYKPLPEPEETMRYAGITLAIDYDRDDYAKLDVTAHFSDNSQVGTRLTLEPGAKAYAFTHGFRHAKWAIAWEKLDWVRFMVDAAGPQGNPVRWRLEKMVMITKENTRSPQRLEIGRVANARELLGDKPAGPGEIEVLAVMRADNRDRDRTADFMVDCALRSFPPGAYRAQWQVDGSEVAPQEAALRLGGEQDITKTFKVRSARNANGTYTFRLTLLNARNEAQACAAEFANSLLVPDLFGKRLLSPRPKQIEWGQGEFGARRHSTLFLPQNATARTLKTGEIFSRKYGEHTGIRLATQPFTHTPPPRGIVLRVDGSALFKGKLTRLNRDGYCLQVDPDRVLVTGGDERGLYYGMVTFFQLMKNDFEIREHMPVPCVEILDWPDLPNRVMMAGHGGAWHYSSYKERRDIDYLIDWVDRFVAQNKANIFYVDLATAVISERRPEFGGKSKLYTLDQLRKLGQFCRDNFVDVCPAWQVGGHANWWLLGLHPELREQGYSNQSDVTHPEHNKIVFDVMLDTIEALGCRYATPKGDEWWHTPKKGEKPQDVIRGMGRAERYLDFQVKCRNFLKSKGVRMLLFSDMISPYHNGQRTGAYKLVDRLPKDVVICDWGGGETAAWFRKHGFEVWRTPNGGGGLDEELARAVNGFGNIIYGTGGDGVGLRDDYNTMQSTYSLCRAADIGWNAYDYPGDEPGREVSIRNLFALRPVGLAGARCTPLDLTGSFTHSFNAYLKQVKPEKYGNGVVPVQLGSRVQEIAHVPMRLGAKGPPDQADRPDSTKRPDRADAGAGNCIILREKSEDVAIPVNARYASLVFLHTAFVHNFKDPRGQPGMNRQWPYGWPCGRYVVRYEDGEQATLPVRLTRDIRRFDTSSRNRATNNNRYVFVLQDCGYDPVHVFQWEWVNPHPHKAIRELVVQHEKQLDVSMILFAITGRDVWKEAR